MPRRPRLFVSGAIYHVYCRVARGEFIFDDHDEAAELIEHLRTVRDLDGWTVFAWVLMGNHYHLVLRTGEIALWRSMARLQGSFSRAFNRRHRFLGRLWQSRYRALVIDSEDYFRQVVAYERMLRHIAVAERIRVVGFLGLLIAAARRGILSQSQARLAIDDAISKHGCRISIDLYQRLLAELGYGTGAE